MLLCLFTALSVGGATIVGTAMGFPCRKLSHRFSDIVLAFAAGVMLSAAILGLILPAISYEEHGGLIVTICGIFAGAGCISLVDRLVPHIHKLIGWEDDLSAHHLRSDRLILFIAAMAIQNYKTFCAMLHQRVHNAMQNHIQSLITNINTSLKA